MDDHLAHGSSLRTAVLAVAAALVSLFAFAPACHPTDATPGAEERCTQRCLDQAPKCEPSSCERGCRFVLDRLVEHEGKTILGCVARVSMSAQVCAADKTWARCAVELGPYVDGGPNAPYIPRWNEEKDDNAE